MIQSDPQKTTRYLAAGKPVVTFGVIALFLAGAVGWLSWLLFQAMFWPVAVFAVIVAICLRGLMQSFPHDVLGMCNAVTLLRAALIAVLVGSIGVAGNPWIIFAIASVAFSLDGLDGWLARRTGLTSAFGARFDMEIDALLGAILALMLVADGTVGPAILVLGFTRYVFVLAGLILPALQGELRESMRRKVICVVQIAALIALIFPVTPAWLLSPVSIGAAAALLYSFAVDTRYLLGQRP